MICLGFSPDWLRKRHEILQRIIKHSNSNTKQSQNNPLVTSEKNFPRIPQKRIDYFNEGKNYVVYKSKKTLWVLQAIESGMNTSLRRLQSQGSKFMQQLKCHVA